MTKALAGMTRRKLLGASAAAAAGGLLAGPATARAAITAPASAVPGGRWPANIGLTDAVVQAFSTYQLVGLGEQHQLQEHHDLLESLLGDPRLPGLVNDIVVEFGNSLYQDVIDRFILGDDLVNDADLRLVWRNTTQSPLETWDAPVYEQFFRRIRAVNWTVPPARRIRVLLGDPPIDWPTITSPQQIGTFLAERDAHAASVVEKEVLARGRRALIHYGLEHLLHLNAIPSLNLQSVVSIVQQHTGVRTYVLTDLVPMAGDPGGLGTQLSRYPRNTVIPAAGTWLGSFDAGDAIGIGVISGGKPVNPFCGVPLGKLQDAGLNLGQPPVLTTSWPDPAIFFDPVYWAELQRRNALQGNVANLDSYRQQQPPGWQLTSGAPTCGTTG